MLLEGLEQILAGAVQTLRPGGRRTGHERVPGHFVDLRVVYPAPMRADNGDVVAGIADIAVDDQVLAVCRDVVAHRFQQPHRGLNMPPDGTDIGLDYAQREFHDGPSCRLRTGARRSVAARQ